MEFHFKTRENCLGLRFGRTFVLAFILICLSGLSVIAQTQLVRITTNVLPPYSPYIQDYPGTGNRVQVFISNLSGKDLSVRLLGKLEGDNGVVVQTSQNYRPLRPLELRSTDVNRLITRVELEGLFDLNQIEVQGMNKNELYRGLPLPEGNYQLCVQAFDNATVRPLSAEFPMGCSGLIPVRIVEPPILISPFEDEEVAAKTPQTQFFSWSAPVGVMPNQVSYTLRIVELPATEVNPNVFIDAVVLPQSGVEVENIRTTSFVYGPQYPPLQFGKRYAWRVQAHAVSQKLNILNDGKSPVQRFQYGLAIAPGIELTQTPFFNPFAKKEETKLLSLDLPVNCSCKTPEPASKKVDNAAALQSRSATIAGFKMELLDGVREEKGVLVGMGTIPVPMVGSGYVKLRVKLIDVQCNAQGEVIGGVVKAFYKDEVAGYMPNMDKPDAPAVQLSPARIRNIGEHFSNAKDDLVSNLKNSAKSTGFELPLGIDKKIGPVETVIAITDVTFTPTQAYFNAHTWIKTPSEQVNGIPLSGYNMCMSPTKPCGEGILYLADNMKLTEYFSLKGSPNGLGGIMLPDTSEVTYVQFDRDGYKKMRMHALLAPPKLINAEAGEAKPLEIAINADIVDFQDWTAEFSFPKFYVQGLEEFKFSMSPGGKGLYDHSEVKTPGALPDGYETNAGFEAWTGLYLPLVDMELPSFLNKVDGSPLIAGVKNLIYDNNGLTGNAFMEDLVKIGDGSMDGWYYSVEELSVAFRKSTFEHVDMKGNLVLPIFNSPENESSQIAYTSTLSKKESGGGFDFQLLATPTETMKSEVLKADIAFTSSSIIASYNQANGFKIEADMSGTIGINVGPLSLPKASFEELKLASQAPYFSLKNFKMGLASPQKEMFGLPVTLTPPTLDITNPARPGINFAGEIALGGEIGITAEGSATLFFNIAKNGARPSWSYDKVTTNDVVVESSNLGPVTFSGKLHFFDQPDLGKGLTGDFKMTVLDKVTGSVKAGFGSMPDYKYWYVGGKIGLNPGVPLSGPVEFQSFGGGLFCNVKKTTSPQGDIMYTPEKSNFGFEASVGLGLTTRDVLSAEATLTMAFGSGTLNSIRIDGDVWLLGSTKEAAFAKGNIVIDVDFKDQIFAADMNLKAGLKTGIVNIDATCPSEFYVDAKNGRWFFAMGVPENRNDLKIQIMGAVGIEFQSYFLMGNFNRHNSAIPPQPYGLEAYSLRAENKLSGLFGDKKLILAFGAGYKMNESFSVGPFRLAYGGALGYDVALQKMDAGCNGVVPGIYGWYAEGQMYAGFHFGLYIDVDLWVYEGTIKVVEMDAAAILYGGFINPTYFGGRVKVRYRVLNGLVKGNFFMGFAYEKEGKCIPPYTPPNPFADLPIISAVSPAEEKSETSILAPGYADFNYPVESDLTIEVPLPKNRPEPTDIGKIYTNSDGERILQRVFRLKLIRKFEFKSTKSAADANCVSDDSGRLTLGRNEDDESNYNASFYRNNALIPKSDYMMTVGVKVFIYNGSKLEPFIFKGTAVEHIVEAKFKTGPCIDELKKGTGDQDLVTASYPYEGQRYFMKGERAATFIKLRRSVQCCADKISGSSDYDLKVVFTPLEGARFATDQSKNSLSAEASFEGDQYTYDLPAGMKNKTLYRFRLIRTPKPEFVDKLLADIQKSKANAKKITTTANVYASNGVAYRPLVNKVVSRTDITGGNLKAGQKLTPTAVNHQYNKSFDEYMTRNGATSVVNEASIKAADIKDFRMAATNNMITEQIKERELITLGLTKTLYQYYFKTSEYNTLSEKLNAAQFPQTATNQFARLADALTTKMVSQEGFDTYEMGSEMLAEGAYRPPMVLLKATSDGAWYKAVAQPIAELLSQLPSSSYQEAMGKDNKFTSKDNTADGFLRGLVKFTNLYDAIEKPMESNEIMQLIPSEQNK